MGFDPVSYVMGKPAGDSGGGGGVVLSGTSTPSASIGNNEDLYIQYEICSPLYDHTYKIVGQFRKVEGSWVAYTKPSLLTAGIRVWTESTGGFDAAVWVQLGYWDTTNQQFVTMAEAVKYVYNTVTGGINLYDLAMLSYGGTQWTLTASVTLTNGTSVYLPGHVVEVWAYSTSIDLMVWKPET